MSHNQPIGIIGIPFDEKSSFLRGPAMAPEQIRKVLNDGSSNFLTENGQVVEEGNQFIDHGDISVNNYLEDIELGISNALEKTDKLISLGGDHSVAYPIIRAFSKKYPDLSILQFDAHTDLYHDFEGDPYSHACPFARIMEEKLVKKLHQVGIRVVSDHQLDQQKKFDVEIITMRDFYSGKKPQPMGPLYISFDLDVFDPGFAPGISHHEPGGMSPREAIELILELDVPLVGADIVEYNPSRDHHGMTAMVAAKLLKELIGKMIS